MLHWNSSSATLWLWQPLSAVFARHTLVAFQCFCGRSSQPRGYYDAFATARAGCSAGREWLLSPEFTAREAPRRCLVRDPGHQKAAWRRRSVAIIAAGLGCEDMLARHVAALVFLPYVSVSPCGSVLVLRGGTPGGCCAWAAAPGVCHRRSRVGELPRHTPQSHCSVTFLALTRDGSSLLFFDFCFCSVLLVRCCSLCFFGLECDSSTVSLSSLYSHMTMSPFWIVLVHRSQGPVAGRRHHCIRVPFDLPRLLNCASRVSCSGVRRNHLVSDVNRCLSRKNVVVIFSLQKVCCELFCHGQVFSRSIKCFSTASHPELQPLDDVRTERGAIALSVGLSWPPDRYTKQTRGRPSWQQLWERALQDHIMNHHELPHGIRLQRPVWPAAHTRGARPHQDSSCRHSRASNPSR